MEASSTEASIASVEVHRSFHGSFHQLPPKKVIVFPSTKILYDEYFTDARNILHTPKFILFEYWNYAQYQVCADGQTTTYCQYWVLSVFLYCGFAVHEGSDGQNAAITATTTQCCVFRVFRTESTRGVFHTSSTCEYSQYKSTNIQSADTIIYSATRYNKTALY